MKQTVIFLFLFFHFNVLYALDFVGRCGLADPPLKISVSPDPTTVVSCKLKYYSNRPYAVLYFTSPVELTVGDEPYSLGPDWHAKDRYDKSYDNCFDAITVFRRNPRDIPFTDAASGRVLRLSLLMLESSIHAMTIEQDDRDHVVVCRARRAN